MNIRAGMMILGLTGLGPWASPAVAQQPQALAVCTGTDTVTFSPGLLLFTPRTSTTTWSDVYPVCLTDQPGITAASSPGGGYTATLSCLDVLTSDPTGGTQRVDWNNGAYSIFAWNKEDVTIINAAGQQTNTINARVIEGLYTGRRLVEVIVTVEPSLLSCLSDQGLVQSEGSITMTVLPL